MYMLVYGNSISEELPEVVLVTLTNFPAESEMAETIHSVLSRFPNV